MQAANRTVTILGAGGFIGGQLVRSLSSAGYQVIAATRKPTQFDAPHVENIVREFNSERDFVPLVSRSCAVIHAASSTTPSSSAAQPQLEDNLRPLLALLAALQTHPQCRLIYLSSGGTVYGNRQRPASEDMRLQPISYHGAGKAAAEQFIQAYAAQYAIPAVILRPSNVYGPGQVMQIGFGIVATAMAFALSEEPLHIRGDGSATRDYLYIDDLTTLCERSISQELENHAQIFNVASGVGVSLNALIASVETVTGHHIKKLFEASRATDIQHIVLDNTLAMRTFSWTPSVSLNDGLEHTWRWIQASSNSRSN